MQQMAIDSGVLKLVNMNHVMSYNDVITTYIIFRAKDERVDWLYSGPGTVNREDYLLGKHIDKFVDPTLAEVEREEEVWFIVTSVCMHHTLCINVYYRIVTVH